VTWWTNIRSEKVSRDLCLLLKLPAVLVSGGLEVASDRLLKLIDKGVTVEHGQSDPQLYRSRGHGALLPDVWVSQTVQETVDSLEMVRQLFEAEYCSLAFGINLP
jgi:hypothetical protein